MNRTLAYLGLDVHKNSITTALIRFNSSEIEFNIKMSSNLGKFLKFVKKISTEYDLRICYEAGCTGYKLYRELTKAGFSCTVIAPSSIPKNQKKVKTDKIDAKKLAGYFKSGILQPVNVPDMTLEEDRDLVRFRESQVKNMTKAKQQIKGFLLRKNISYDHEKTWNKKFLDWLGTMELRSKDRITLNRYTSHLNYQTKLVEEVGQEITGLSKTDKYKNFVEILCGFRGIDITTAMIIVTHIADFRSFSHPKHLTSYIGVTPGADDSGEKKRGLSITKTGNNLLRKAFVSAAQHYSATDKVGSKLRSQRQDLSSSIRAIIERCDRRCRKIYWKLVLSGRCVNIAKTAVAREMITFVWEAMMVYHQGELRQTG